MKVIFGYDVMTYNGPLPNCLNPKFIPTIYDGSNFEYNKSHHYFNDKWGSDYCVFNSHDYNKITLKKNVFDIVSDRENGNDYKWFYLIEPHSGLDLFFGKHSIHNEFAMNFISDKAINEVKNHNGNLLFNYTIDGGIGINQDNLQMIIDFTRAHNIPDEKVYFIFADYKLKDNFKKLGANYNVHDFSFYLFFKSHEFNNIIEGRETKSTIQTKEDYVLNIENNKKDFLLLTRHWKQHRIFLLNKVHRLGLDNSLVSWESSYYSDKMVDVVRHYDNNVEFFEMLKTSRHVDVKDLVAVWGYGSESKDIYVDTYLSIVTESIFYQEDINFPSGFISEKIWKPIGHCQPFILAGPSNSLKYLRERFGFKTFHPYIDETYDMVEDEIKRIELIQNEMEKFSKKSKQEKIEFLKNVKDICFYNLDLFLQFDKNYVKDLDKNPELRMVYNFLM
jgi:hypothetical protein